MLDADIKHLTVVVLFFGLWLSACSGVEGLKATNASVGALAVEPVALPEAQTGANFTSRLTVTGGKSPYTWSISSGALPPGLSSDSTNGTIAGTPVQAGTSSFLARVQDSTAGLGSHSLKLQVRSDALWVEPATLPEAQTGVNFKSKLTVTGGKSPYTWSISSGALPPGFSIDNTSGTIDGMPSQAGTFPFTVCVRDSVLASGCRTLSLQVLGLGLDQYGGLTALPSAHGATGFFHIEQFGQRWFLVSPDGNQFWLSSVYGVGPGNGGSEYAMAIAAKYGASQTFASQAVRRLRSWSFNTIGEYSATYVYPVGVYGLKTGNPEQLPFIRLIRPSIYSLKSGKVKDIVIGVDAKAYTGYRGTFPDVFDPAFQAYANQMTADQIAPQEFTLPLDPSPWIIGTTIDDADDLYGFKTNVAAHDGWLVAITSPTQVSNYGVTYADQTVYSKQAWANYLQSEYGTIGALNAAWGSNYTTFGSAGGWGVGTGLLDENGRNPWIGKDYSGLTDTAPAAHADMNGFLGLLATQYFSVVTGAARAATPHHLVFGPAALSGSARPQIVEAAAKYVDAFQVYGPPTDETCQSTGGACSIANVYNLSGKPLFVWLTLTSQKDSPLAAYPGRGPGFDFPTQAARGAQYTATLQQLANIQGKDGLYPVLGIDWWEWVDQIVGGEHANFGLVTDLDNAYDGREDVIPLGKDPWGYTTGGQAADYGDFLFGVQRENLLIPSALSVGQNP